MVEVFSEFRVACKYVHGEIPKLIREGHNGKYAVARVDNPLDIKVARDYESALELAMGSLEGQFNLDLGQFVAIKITDEPEHLSSLVASVFAQAIAQNN